MKAQNIDRLQLVYHNKWQPYVAYWGMVWCLIFVLITGYAVFWDFNASDFLTAC